MKKHAILLRLNPQHWPKWDSKLAQGYDVDVWFTTGRRRADDIYTGIPVVVLGTDNLGVVACGETSSCVEFRSDTDWEESPLEFQSSGKINLNRVCVKIRRVRLAAKGMTEFAANSGRARWVTSPILGEADWEVLQEGSDARQDDVLKLALEISIADLKKTLEQETLSALAWLVDDGILDFKLAMPRTSLIRANFMTSSASFPMQRATGQLK